MSWTSKVVSARFAASLAICSAPALAGDPDPAPKPQPSPAEAPKNVRITNIGLHIGGGPNDAATKAPFQKAIAASFGEIEKCHASAETKDGTFGVDLLVPAEGGHAKVSDPRTAMKGDAFVACVVKAFEGVVFDKGKRGATRFSYSLKFETER